MVIFVNVQFIPAPYEYIIIKMYSCEICREEFKSNNIKANHIRWKHKDNTKYKLKISNIQKRAEEEKHGKWIIEKTICSKHNCNKEFEIKYRTNKKKEKYFCCRSCANYRGSTKKYFTDEVKKKCASASKKAWGDGIYKNNKIFTSKNERLLVKYFKEKFPDYKWKNGGSLKYKDQRIVRDLWSDVLKICFEYDGVWHFKDIHGQLEKKQQKDKLLEEWCLENNYRLIRIDELEYISPYQIEKLIFEKHNPILKIGKRY